MAFPCLMAAAFSAGLWRALPIRSKAADDGKEGSATPIVEVGAVMGESWSNALVRRWAGCVQGRWMSKVVSDMY
jgi:hypothetical protein